MKNTFKIISGIACVMVVVFCLQWLGIINYRFFASKREDARREVFENTQSFVEAKRQAITKYYNEWRVANDENKAAIRMVVLQEFANFDLEYFSPTQRNWYNAITN